MTEKELISIAEKAVQKLIKENKTLSVAESCTGGWLSKILTDISGVSQIYKGGVCSYANETKKNILGVEKEALDAFGAVSEQVAYQMANGVRKALNTDIGIGITGIAGPTSDNTEKPVGLIYVAISNSKKTTVTQLRNNFTDDIRTNNRLSAIEAALNLLGGINE